MCNILSTVAALLLLDLPEWEFWSALETLDK